MKKMMLMVVAMAVAVVFVSGCTTASFSMNYQKSVARCAGDIGATIALEQGKVDSAKVIEVAGKIEKFLKETDISTITRADLIAKMEDVIKIPALQKYAAKIVGLVPETMDLTSGKKLMLQACKGMVIAAQQWEAGDKVKTGETIPEN